MIGPKREKQSPSRRTFLKQLSWAPVLFLPGSIQGRMLRQGCEQFPTARIPHFPFADARFVPHYPEKSSLDDLLRLAAPGTDEYTTEGYAAQIIALLAEWSRELRLNPPGRNTLQRFLSSSIDSGRFSQLRETRLRSGNGIEVFRREIQGGLVGNSEQFVSELTKYFGTLKHLEIADFEIYRCEETASSPLTLEADIRYEFVGSAVDESVESRIGSWATRWIRENTGTWKLSKCTADSEIVSRSPKRLFVDITRQVLGGNESYKNQLLHGADYWRTILDGAIGVDVYGNNGVAVGDFDNDGVDDLYVCQPAGLPNRLYRNRGDGTLEDVTDQAGVGVLDFSACALFADFENRGLQDLLVVCASGPLLFINDRKGKYSLKKDAFHFAQPPQGSFTHAAIADYDRDGRLDIYFCLYSYYQGLDQYRYPVPYFDARNGPQNYLLRNSGNWSFEDRTQAAGLNVDNDRYSFACTWGDVNGDGWPDLYVVNDFGRNVLYRNHGDGTFAAVSSEAHVDEAGAGMSACWLDFDNDGKQDIYAAGMWVSAGMRVFEDSHFHPGEPEEVRSLYRRHMNGNSLYQNQGDGRFENVATRAGVEMGRWSWSTDAWDFDHDGYPDLYVANGYISGLEQRDVSSFFWRQVVAKSPRDSTPSPEYEHGWGAMNELIRSASTWNGHERNVFFANNCDGTFSDVSGISGLDFRDDSRAFALADLDGDGRLEIILKNRNAPQLRILRNEMKGIGRSISLHLTGDKSNRDAIGAAVTITNGSLKQTKYVRAGSGFLSQHTKALFFGLGGESNEIKASVRWPSGLTQDFGNLPANHRIELREGDAKFRANPFAAVSAQSSGRTAGFTAGEGLPSSWRTWLVDPVTAPEFSLPDLSGKAQEITSFRGNFVLLNLCQTNSDLCRQQLQLLKECYSLAKDRGLQIVAVNFDDQQDSGAQSFFAKADFPFPVLRASAEMAGIYNLVYRYLFDRHRDLSFPTCFLIDGSGDIVHISQGLLHPQDILKDLNSAPTNPADRMRKALPFAGTLHQDEFHRNALTYGVAFFQHGFLDQAERSFQRVIADKPEDADAFYNLGTLYLRRNQPEQAKQSLERAVKLRPSYPEAWNNLGMLAAQQGENQEAIRNFQQSLTLRPSYTTALLNLGNLYRKQGDSVQAETLIKRAYHGEPENPEVNYSLGMVYARGNQPAMAEQYLRSAIKLRPDYADALNNLGVLLIQLQRYPEAEANLKACIAAAPAFDQAYLNLARLYVVLNNKEKARAVLEALLQKQPQHKMAQQMLQLLY